MELEPAKCAQRLIGAQLLAVIQDLHPLQEDGMGTLDRPSPCQEGGVMLRRYAPHLEKL